jgi:hypothetical protein
MVPVLSSSSTSTSPAASTARPEVAITLACIMRLMPATPMADSRPPMVVGIRHTSSATSTVMPTGRPAGGLHAEQREGQQRHRDHQEDDGQRHQQDGQRDLVGRLLALGAFDHAIMRSRKVSPGLTVTRTTIQSDSTRVPPVTARSRRPRGSPGPIRR